MSIHTTTLRFVVSARRLLVTTCLGSQQARISTCGAHAFDGFEHDLWHALCYLDHTANFVTQTMTRFTFWLRVTKWHF